MIHKKRLQILSKHFWDFCVAKSTPNWKLRFSGCQWACLLYPQTEAGSYMPCGVYWRWFMLNLKRTEQKRYRINMENIYWPKSTGAATGLIRCRNPKYWSSRISNIQFGIRPLELKITSNPFRVEQPSFGGTWLCSFILKMRICKKILRDYTWLMNVL